jgi:putative transposase
MQRTIRLKLKTTAEQDAILADTAEQSRACFNAVAEHGWPTREKNGVTLHNATYYALRAAHPTLPSQLVISARTKATEALRSAIALEKKGETVSVPTARNSTIRYDARSYRMEVAVVGLSTVAGRIKLPFRAYDQAQALINHASGFDIADLVRSRSGWWLHVVLTIPTPAFVASGSVIGVDLGINRPAVTSKPQFLGERRWKEIEQRYFRLNRKLQAKGTKSAKRHLKKIARRRGRFRRDCDHVLSKRIVENAAPGSVIVIENLKGIRSRTKQRGTAQRRRHHSWSYEQFRSFLEYKGEGAGHKVVAVDPSKTSQRCCKCGHTSRSNRRSQSVFKCRSCGYEANADLNASRNIAWKYQAEAGKTGSGVRTVNAHIVGEVAHVA